MIGAIVAIPFILTPALCMEDENPQRGTIISTMIFVTGIVTAFQATFGCRLPLVQGGTISFLVPTLALLNLEKWKCPSKSIIAAMTTDEKEELWQIRMR
jgi:solute carrier family 23 (nucleobase transporter), member 1